MRPKEIESIIETGLAIAGHPISEHLEVQNLADALEWIEGWARADVPLRTRDVLHVHGILHTGVPGTTPGQFRASELRVGGMFDSHTPGREIPRHIQALCTRINGRPGRKQHPIDRAVLAMTTLMTLLPFREGNDLVARLILNGLLLQRAYPIADFPDPARLRECQQAALAGNLPPLTALVAAAVEAGLDRYLKALA
ncbi:MAG: Fic family protein [Candidatus Sericytochromatia bacterium]|nr:Fic family protein [Candidatus Sericytochromatia bacterium]